LDKGSLLWAKMEKGSQKGTVSQLRLSHGAIVLKEFF